MQALTSSIQHEDHVFAKRFAAVQAPHQDNQHPVELLRILGVLMTVQRRPRVRAMMVAGMLHRKMPRFR
jgi:hypothetical protein